MVQTRVHELLSNYLPNILRHPHLLSTMSFLNRNVDLDSSNSALSALCTAIPLPTATLQCSALQIT